MFNSSPYFAARPVLSRYLVLSTYTLCAALQGLTWALPGAVAPTYSSLYCLSGDTLQLLLNYGPIFYLLAALPVTYSLDRHGIRLSVVSALALISASAALRLLATGCSAWSQALLHASFILNALAGPAAMGVPSKLAEAWFPPSERTLATAISALGNQSGGLLLYLLVAAAFPNPTASDNAGLNACLAALCALNAGLAGVYFPLAPPSPPSASASLAHASASRVSLRTLLQATQRLAANRSFLAILLAYAASTGLLNCVAAMLPQALGAFAGNPQATAGWVNFASNGASMLVGSALGGATDVMKASYPPALKLALCACLAASGVCFMAYAWLVAGGGGGAASATTLWLVAGLYTAASLFQGASIPLMFECSAEHTGAGGEGGGEEEGAASQAAPTGVMLMVLTTMSNAVSLVVLFMPNSTFFVWANWGGAGIFLASAAFLALVLPSTLPRYSFDRQSALHKQPLLGLELELESDSGSSLTPPP